MEKTRLVATAMTMTMFFLILTFGPVSAAISEYEILPTTGNITILPVNGGKSVLSVVVIKSDTQICTPGLNITCIFSEAWPGELSEFGKVQNTTTQGGLGIASIPIPSCDTEYIRSATILVSSDTASVKTVMFWYTENRDFPASIVSSSPPQLDPGETGEFIFQVLNAWKEPLAGIEVDVVLGNSYTQEQTSTTKSEGKATFWVTSEESGFLSFSVKLGEPFGFIQGSAGWLCAPSSQ